jgi:hypothetical protein
LEADPSTRVRQASSVWRRRELSPRPENIPPAAWGRRGVAEAEAEAGEGVEVEVEVEEGGRWAVSVSMSLGHGKMPITPATLATLPILAVWVWLACAPVDVMVRPLLLLSLLSLLLSSSSSSSSSSSFLLLLLLLS